MQTKPQTLSGWGNYPKILGEVFEPKDENDLMLLEGFKSRVVAITGKRPLRKYNYRPSRKSNYKWHRAPDGGAVFSTRSGGWIYVSNSEDAEALANSICKLNKLSIEDRTRFGSYARDYYEKEFERNRLLKRLIDIFEK